MFGDIVGLVVIPSVAPLLGGKCLLKLFQEVFEVSDGHRAAPAISSTLTSTRGNASGYPGPGW